MCAQAGAPPASAGGGAPGSITEMASGALTCASGATVGAVTCELAAELAVPLACAATVDTSVVAIKCAYGGLACAAWVLFVLFGRGGRGSQDWSDFWTFTFCGAFVAAVVLSLAGGLIALFSRHMNPGKRLAVIGIGIGIPAVAVLFVIALLQALSHLS